MKTLSDINAILDRFSAKYDLPNMKDAAQGSAGWFQTKLGVISASNADRVIAGKTTAARATYMAELVAQVCTGNFEEINSKHMDWGKQNEDAARAQYDFVQGTRSVPLPFVFKDDSHRIGCSPDSIVGPNKGNEIKCPWASHNYIQFLTADKVKPEWRHQCQFTMWVMDADAWDMVQFDPRMPSKQLAILQMHRDPEAMKVFDDLVPQFIFEMDAMLKSIGFQFGDQWRKVSIEAKSQAESFA